MNYNEALGFIHSVNNYFCKPGLERIKALCEYLGNPQDALQFVHVAGTNGKGSFCSMLTSILKNAGYRVGTYTSPYILNFNERIRVNGENIADDDLAELCDIIKPFCDSTTDKPTEFEIITALGFEYFRRQKCDIVVLECGLGGRYDATNLIDTPVLSVITGVDFDHQNFLGDTIEQIASEKAGIIKKDVPCIWCGDNVIAENIIKDTAKSMGSTLLSPNHQLIDILNSNLRGTNFNYKDYKNLFIPLLGTYQPLNAANAVTAAECLKGLGYNITEQNIYDGLKDTVWHARFEMLKNNPPVIFDGAHNSQGVTAAVKSVMQYFGNNKVNVLTGVMKDKDYLFIAKEIGKIADNVFCITPDNPRALEARDYAEVFRQNGVTATAYENMNDGIAYAIKQSASNNKPLVILGSLY
ncbi:MAG: bifunctional folylpolyglutamate synthase/dihydrofolate synthase, partial [Clostridia bacterium]|nr:bifunctional folylpolyglutamate synthase/dihydrofolate synthase [Clostridia bacterium]